MSVERVISCDRGDCEVHVRTAIPSPYVPESFLEVRFHERPTGLHTLEFCSWDCLMHYAAARPLTELIPWSDP